MVVLLINDEAPRDEDMESQNAGSLSTVLRDHFAFYGKVIMQLEDEGVYICYWLLPLHVCHSKF